MQQTEAGTLRGNKLQWEAEVQFTRTLEEELFIDVSRSSSQGEQNVPDKKLQPDEDWKQAMKGHMKIRHFLQGGTFKAQPCKLVADFYELGTLYMDVAYNPPEFPKKFFASPSKTGPGDAKAQVADKMKRLEIIKKRKEMMKPKRVNSFYQLHTLPSVQVKKSSQPEAHHNKQNHSTIFTQLPRIKTSINPLLYRNYIFGYGMSNIHSVFTL